MEKEYRLLHKKEEMKKMTDREVALLERLHENTSDGLY